VSEKFDTIYSSFEKVNQYVNKEKDNIDNITNKFYDVKIQVKNVTEISEIHSQTTEDISNKIEMQHNYISGISSSVHKIKVLCGDLKNLCEN